MKIGVVFPQTELGGDVGAVRAYGEAVEELGFSHILAYDHVVGADPAVHTGWAGAYEVATTFHEPFVMFGYLAAVTRAEMVTGIIILPQRQTVLVAKQAAEVDLLTGGRFRLGVGLGWNAVEYEALQRDFHDRGKRMTEQIELMRRLWTEGTVTHRGSSEVITAAGINPLPVQRPIPVWIGAASDAAYRRIGRVADGWFPMMRPGPDLERALGIIEEAATQVGRDASAIGMEGRAVWSTTDVERALRQVQAWRDANATHLTINTMGQGYGGVDGHLAAITQAAEALL